MSKCKLCAVWEWFEIYLVRQDTVHKIHNREPLVYCLRSWNRGTASLKCMMVVCEGYLPSSGTLRFQRNCRSAVSKIAVCQNKTSTLAADFARKRSRAQCPRGVHRSGHSQEHMLNAVRGGKNQPSNRGRGGSWVCLTQWLTGFLLKMPGTHVPLTNIIIRFVVLHSCSFNNNVELYTRFIRVAYANDPKYGHSGKYGKYEGGDRTN